MKKNLFFYLFALICSVSLFTACSDDDDPNWKKLPSKVITTENLTLISNELVMSDASVQLSMTDAQSGVLTLTNAVRGLNTVAVNVTVQEQPDGWFKFQGEQNVSTSTKAVSDLVSAILVKVSGTISIEGEAQVNVLSEANGALVKKWVLTDSLSLDAENKIWKFAPFKLNWKSAYGEGSNAGIAAENLTLIGTKALSSLMTLMLKDIEFTPDGSIVATYADDPTIDTNALIGSIMGESMPSTEGIKWTTSPKNLAYWVAADNHMKVILNIPAIVAQEMDEDSALTPEAVLGILQMLKGMNGAEVKELVGGLLAGMAQQNPMLAKIDLSKISDSTVEMLIDYVFNGIPVNFKVETIELAKGGTVESLCFSIDKQFFDAFMPVLYPLLPDLDAMVKQIEIEIFGSKMPVWSFVQLLTGLNSLTEIEPMWQKTSLFELGLGLGNTSFVAGK